MTRAAETNDAVIAGTTDQNAAADVGQLIDAAARADENAFGAVLLAILDQGAEGVEAAARAALSVLTATLAENLPAEPTVADVAAVVAAAFARTQAVVPVNRVLLEHTARACVGLSAFATQIDPAFLVLYAALLAGALGPAAAESVESAGRSETGTPAVARELDPAVAELIEAAITAASSADPMQWQDSVRAAVAIDPVTADDAARAHLRGRLDSQGLPDQDRVSAIAAGALVLAAASADGPFACPAYILELVMRRALGEPGSVEGVDLEEVTFVATEATAMIDIHDRLLPPGWGIAVHLPID